MVDENGIDELLDRLPEGRSAEEVVGGGGLLAEFTIRLMESQRRFGIGQFHRSCSRTL